MPPAYIYKRSSSYRPMNESELAELTSKINLLNREFGQVMNVAKANEITLSMLYLCSTHFNEFLRSVMEKADPEHGAALAEDLAGIANNWVKTNELRIWASRRTEEWAKGNKEDELI